MSKKTIFESIDEYKYKTMRKLVGKGNYIFKDKVCSIYGNYCAVSCPSWTTLNGKYDKLFGLNNQLGLFDEDEELKEAVYSVIDPKCLHLDIELKYIANSYQSLFEFLMAYGVKFIYSGNTCTIHRELGGDDENCEAKITGLVSKKKYIKTKIYEPYQLGILQIFKHVKVLTAQTQIYLTGRVRFYHDEQFTAIQINYVDESTRQHELMTAITYNKEHVEKMKKE